MEFTTILFDLDHTLLDSHESEELAFDDTMRSIGIEGPEAVLPTYRTINSALWRKVELGELGPNEVSRLRFVELLDELELEGDPDAMGERFRRGLGAFGELYSGASELLEALGHARLGLVTNGIGQVQRDRLKRLDLNDHFDGVAISGEVGVAKPDPAIFNHLGFGAIDPATTIMIGDSLTSDIAAGARAGFTTCWYNPNGAPMNGEHPPTITIDALVQIREVVGAR